MKGRKHVVLKAESPESMRQGTEYGAGRSHLLIPFVAAAYFLFVKGYRYPWGDQLHYLLLPYRDLYPDFALRDWLVWEGHHYHLFFASLVKALFFLGEERGLPIGMFIVWFVFLCAFFDGLWCLTRSSGGTWGHFLVVVMLFAYFGETGPAMSVLIQPYLVPASIALSILTYGVAFLITGKSRIAFTLLGFASLVHIAVGPLGLAFFSIYLLLSEERFPLRKICEGWCISLALGSFGIVHTLSESAARSGGEWLSTLNLRSPHHYHPPTYLARWSEAEVYFSLVLMFLWIYRRQTPKSIRLAVLACLIAISGCVVSYFVGGPEALTRIFPWRIAPYILIFGNVEIAKYVLRPGALIRPSFVVMILCSIGVLRMKVPLAYSVLCVTSIVITLLLLDWLRQSKKSAFLSTGVVVAMLVLTSGLRFGRISPSVRPLKLLVENDALTWIRDNTSPLSLFVVPPDLEEFRVLAGRAIIVDFKGAPIGNERALEVWKARLEQELGVEDLRRLDTAGFPLQRRLTEIYLRLSPEKIRAFMERYGAEYFLTYDRHLFVRHFESNGFVPVHSQGGLVLFRVIRHSNVLRTTDRKTNGVGEGVKS